MLSRKGCFWSYVHGYGYMVALKLRNNEVLIIARSVSKGAMLLTVQGCRGEKGGWFPMLIKSAYE